MHRVNFVKLAWLLIAAVWSPAEKGLTARLSYLLFMFRVCHVFLSVHCSLVVTCGEGLASCLSSMLCFIVIVSLFHMVSWVRCGTWTKADPKKVANQQAMSASIKSICDTFWPIYCVQGHINTLLMVCTNVLLKSQLIMPILTWSKHNKYLNLTKIGTGSLKPHL